MPIENEEGAAHDAVNDSTDDPMSNVREGEGAPEASTDSEPPGNGDPGGTPIEDAGRPSDPSPGPPVIHTSPETGASATPFGASPSSSSSARPPSNAAAGTAAGSESSAGVKDGIAGSTPVQPGGTSQPGAPSSAAGHSTSVLPLPSWWSFVLIGAAMLVVLIVVSQTTKYYFQWRAGVLTEQFRLAPPDGQSPQPTSADIARSIPSACPVLQGDEKRKDISSYVLKQRAQAVELGDGHRRAAIEFGSYFFANVAILGVFGLISLISVAVIAKTGLDAANGHVVAIFLLATGTGLLYQSFFGVFQQRQNIEANLGQAILYAQIVSKIDTYCTTGSIALSDPKAFLEARSKIVSASENTNTSQPAEAPNMFFTAVEPEVFVLYIDWNLETLRKFAVSFDDKLVPSLTDTNRLSLNSF